MSLHSPKVHVDVIRTTHQEAGMTVRKHGIIAAVLAFVMSLWWAAPEASASPTLTMAARRGRVTELRREACLDFPRLRFLAEDPEHTTIGQ